MSLNPTSSTTRPAPDPGYQELATAYRALELDQRVEYLYSLLVSTLREGLIPGPHEAQHLLVESATDSRTGLSLDWSRIREGIANLMGGSGDTEDHIRSVLELWGDLVEATVSAFQLDEQKLRESLATLVISQELVDSECQQGHLSDLRTEMLTLTFSLVPSHLVQALERIGNDYRSANTLGQVLVEFASLPVPHLRPADGPGLVQSDGVIEAAARAYVNGSCGSEALQERAQEMWRYIEDRMPEMVGKTPIAGFTGEFLRRFNLLHFFQCAARQDPVYTPLLSCVESVSLALKGLALMDSAYGRPTGSDDLACLDPAPIMGGYPTTQFVIRKMVHDNIRTLCRDIVLEQLTTWLGEASQAEAGGNPIQGMILPSLGNTRALFGELYTLRRDLIDRWAGGDFSDRSEAEEHLQVDDVTQSRQRLTLGAKRIQACCSPPP